MLRKQPLEQNVRVPPPFLSGAGGFPPHVKGSMMGGGQKHQIQPSHLGPRTEVLAGPGISLIISLGGSLWSLSFLLCCVDTIPILFKHGTVFSKYNS